MNRWARIVAGAFLCSSLEFVAITPTYAASVSEQGVTRKQGEIEFRVGSSKSTVISGARVIVILHDGKVVSSGLTDKSGTWTTKVPFYPVEWNEHFTTKGIVNAIVVADGYNEQVVFVIPVTSHTVQPVVLEPVKPNARNLPSASLGNIHQHNLRQFVARYAQVMGLTKQTPIPGDFGYAPWSPVQKTEGKAR